MGRHWHQLRLSSSSVGAHHLSSSISSQLIITIDNSQTKQPTFIMQTKALPCFPCLKTPGTFPSWPITPAVFRETTTPTKDVSHGARSPPWTTPPLFPWGLKRISEDHCVHWKVCLRARLLFRASTIFLAAASSASTNKKSWSSSLRHRPFSCTGHAIFCNFLSWDLARLDPPNKPYHSSLIRQSDLIWLTFSFNCISVHRFKPRIL